MLGWVVRELKSNVQTSQRDTAFSASHRPQVGGVDKLCTGKTQQSPCCRSLVLTGMCMSTHTSCCVPIHRCVTPVVLHNPHAQQTPQKCCGPPTRQYIVRSEPHKQHPAQRCSAHMT
jgi:hypothetical protein